MTRKKEERRWSRDRCTWLMLQTK